jgi:thioester reductase domain
MKKYSSRPAIGERDYEYIQNPITKEISIKLLPQYKTITFKQLWDRVEHIANEWYHHPQYPLKDGDKVAILAFTSSDYACIDIACIRLGAVSIHLQTSSTKEQMQEIITQAEPSIIAASVEYIDIATQLANANTFVKRLIVFDFHENVDEHANKINKINFEQKNNKSELFIEPLNNILKIGIDLPLAPLPNNTTEEPLSMLIYTSGSTGYPKGAMYTEKLASGMWGGNWSKIFSDEVAITIHYMPMSHVAGHSSLKNTLARGGISYFTSKSNLSSFFEDIYLVKPTELSLVPRVCEMIYQYYNSELIKRRLFVEDNLNLEIELKDEMKNHLLGGRITWAGCASAPLSKELHIFIESILKIKLHNIYGSTEAGVIWIDNKLLKPPVNDYKIIDVPELGYYSTDKPYPRGELLLKTESIIPGYYKMPELNYELFDKDGYYITGDIVEEISDSNLNFIERRKNVIKLSQGEFVTLSAIEVIFSSSTLIKQIFIYGNGTWSSLLAVIVPTPETLMNYTPNDKELKRLLRDSIRKIANDHGLKPYEIPRDFIIESKPFTQRNGLLSDHGKPVWHKLKSYYSTALNELYEKLSKNEINELNEIYKNKDLQRTIDSVIQIASSLVGGMDNIGVSPTLSFREIGGDSLSAVTFSVRLEEVFGIRIPVDKIVSPIYTLNDISEYIDSKKDTINARPDFTTIHGIAPTDVYANQLLLSKFIDKAILDQINSLSVKNNLTHNKILLTGASGYLGRFLCLKLLEELSTSEGELICIVRGKDEKTARQRLYDSFRSSDENLYMHFKSLADKFLTVLIGDISEPKLGLNDEEWDILARDIDTIYHIGALVNHVLSYDNIFDANVLGTVELIELALTKRIKKFVFMSSIAVAAASQLDEYSDIRTSIPSQKINSDYANGYAISKWACEVLLKEANEKYSLPVTVFRSSMILAHSIYNEQININDMFTRLLLSLIQSEIAPKSFYKQYSNIKPHYDGLPVDFTVSAIISLSKENNHHLTYNLVNPHDDGISLDTIVDWIIESGVDIKKIENYQNWLKQFEDSMNHFPDNLKPYSYLHLLYGIGDPQEAIAGSIIPSNRFISEIKKLNLEIPHISLSLIKKYISDLKLLGLLQKNAIHL